MTPTRTTTASLALAAVLALVPPAVAVGAQVPSGADRTGGGAAATGATTAGVGPGDVGTAVAGTVAMAQGLPDAAGAGTLTTALQEAPAAGDLSSDPAAAAAGEPDDPAYRSLQWSLWDEPAALGMPLAWPLATGAGQTIAVVDTGITAHPDLDANLLPGYDFVSTAHNGRDGDGWDADPTDMGDYPDAALCPESPMQPASTWHGTATAGVAAADAGNGIGIAGVAPDAKILPVRVVGACSQGYMTDVAAGVAWASGAPVAGVPANPTPASVINLSLGVQGPCPAVLQEAINGALARGVPVVAAAGNQGIDAAHSAPANCAGVLSVAATDVAGALAPYSNFGSVTLAAPGGDPWAQIHSTGNAGAQVPAGPAYADGNGTSMAAPAVAGAVALIREVAPHVGVAGIREALTSTARSAPGGCAPGCGAGIIDPVSALIKVRGGDPFTTGGAIGALHGQIAATAGEPVSRELCALGGQPCFQEFANGWILWSPAEGARWVGGMLPLGWWAMDPAG